MTIKEQKFCESKEYKTVHCKCGKDEHYSDSIYCSNCGKKLEGAALTTSSNTNHL